MQTVEEFSEPTEGSTTISPSRLTQFLRDRVAYWHRYIKRDWPKPEPTAAMKFGTDIHKLIENKFDVSKLVVTIPEKFLRSNGSINGGSKEYKEWSKSHKNQIQIKPGEFDWRQAVKDSVERNRYVSRLIRDRVVTHEQSMEGFHPESGLWLRLRIDGVSTCPGAIWDLKVTGRDLGSASGLRMFHQDLERLGHMRQFAAYRWAVRQQTGETLPFVVVTIADKPSHRADLIEIDSDWLDQWEHGTELIPGFHQEMVEYADCAAKDLWLHRDCKVLRLSAPMRWEPNQYDNEIEGNQ